MDEERFQIRKIVGQRENDNGKLEFEVEWKTTWESEETLKKLAQNILDEFKLKNDQSSKKDADSTTDTPMEKDEEPGIDDLFSSSSATKSLPFGKSRKSTGKSFGINAIISRLQKSQKEVLAKQPIKMEECDDETNVDVNNIKKENDDKEDEQPRVYGVTGSAPKNKNNSYSSQYPMSPTEAHEGGEAALPTRSATYYSSEGTTPLNGRPYTPQSSSTPYSDSSRAHSTSSIQNLRSNVDTIPKLFPPDSIEQRNLESMYKEHNPKHKMNMAASSSAYKCSICSEVFYEQSKFKQHMFMHDQVNRLKQDPPKLLKPGTYQCKFCNILFDDKEKLRLHYSETHEREYASTQPQDQLFKCSICSLTFVDHNKLVQHGNQEHAGKRDVFILPKTGIHFTDTGSSSSLDGNKPSLSNTKNDEDDSVFEDNQVKKSAMTTLDFQPVNDALMSKSAGEKKMYRCNICDELFETESDRANHSLVHVNRSASLDCHICGKTFKHRTNLSTHLVVHSGVKPHQCHVCLRRFTQKVNLQRHMHIHDGSRPFTCKFCLKSFTQRANLQRHILSHTEIQKDDLVVALNEIPNESEVNNAINESLNEAMSAITETSMLADKPEFRCEVCDKTFAQKVNLQKHMLIHTGSRPFQCYVCGKAFRQRVSLQKHYTLHTNGSTSFICQTCNRLFVSRTNLQRHMLVHVSAGTHQCYLCDRNFTTDDNLERHFSEHVEEALPTISLPQKYFEQSTPGQNFRCATCDIVFDSPIIFSQHLQCHQRGFSPDSTPNDINLITKTYEDKQSCTLQCNTCGSIFMSVAKLEQHMKTHADPNQSSSSSSSPRCHAIGVMIVPETADFKHGPRDMIGNTSPKADVPIKQEESNASLKNPSSNRVSRCPVCKEMFNSKMEMRKHYSSVHLEHQQPSTPIAMTPPSSGAMVLQFEGTKYIATPMVTQQVSPLVTNDFEVSGKVPETSKSFEINEDTPGVITESEEILIKENEDFIKDNILGGPHEYETKGRYERGNYSCKICNRVLTYKYSLEKHMLLHAGSFPYKCTMCSKRFSHKANLDKHLVTHNGEKPFSCHICQRPFSQRSNLQRHQLTHTQNRDFICDVCGKRFNHMASLKTHSLIHTGAKPFACFICNKRFNQKGNLKRHVQTHRSGKRNKVNGLNAGNNDHMNSSETAMKYEDIDYPGIKLKHEVKDEEEEEGEASDSRRSSRNSRIAKRSIDGYDYEDDDEPLPTMIADDEDSMGQSLDCPIETSSRSLNNSTTSEMSYELGEDILTVVPSDALELPETSNTTRSPVRTRKQTFPCDSCSKLFISAESLDAHKRSTHHIVCDVCGKKFSQKANLLKHKLIHMNKKPFECKVCHKAFRQKANLQRHELIHNKDRKTVNCSVCHKAFRCTWSLKQHMKGHAANGMSASFGCSICGKTFNKKNELQKHFDVHKNENQTVENHEGMVVVMNGDEEYEDDGMVSMVTNNNNNGSDFDEENEEDEGDDILTVVTNENNELQLQ